MESYKQSKERPFNGVDNFDIQYVIAEPTPTSPNRIAYENKSAGIYLFHANCLEIMDALITKYPNGYFDMIFADPPYFLSNGGITCQAGKMVRVDKGEWDKSGGVEVNHAFNIEWLKRCRNF